MMMGVNYYYAQLNSIYYAPMNRMGYSSYLQPGSDIYGTGLGFSYFNPNYNFGRKLSDF